MRIFLSVEYRKGQLATLMSSGKWLNNGDPAHIALSPDGLVIAIGSGTRLSIHSAASGETLAQIDEVHAGLEEICFILHQSIANSDIWSLLFALKFIWRSVQPEIKDMTSAAIY